MSSTRSWLRYVAIAGNAAFVLWVLYNGIDEGFRGGPVAMASMVGLIVVLALDTVLLWPKR